MNADLSKNETFETCDKNQTAIEPNTNTFEPCDKNQTKTGRGGARPNSGMKSSGVETVTVRIDKRLLNTVTTIKSEFKNGNLNLNDLFAKPEPQNNDSELLRELEELRSEHEIFIAFSKERIQNIRNQYDAKIERLINRIEELLETPADTKQGNLDDKEIKRLIQFLHPDKQVNEKNRAIATELTAILNGLRGGQ